MASRVTEIENANIIAGFAAAAQQPYSLLLDSADGKHPDGRYSFAMWHPVEMIEAKNGRITITNSDQQTALSRDPFHCVQERLNAWGIGRETHAHLPPFQGGAAGFFGYDLARGLETLPSIAAEDRAMPDMAIGIYLQVLACDHKAGKAWLITHGRDEEEAAIREHAGLRMLARGDGQPPQTGAVGWTPRLSAATFEKDIARVIEAIHAGDIFQANLAQRFDALLPPEFDAFAHYQSLRTVNPAPFAGFMNLGSVKISSASPERFLRVRDGMIETRPIKGTRPRRADAQADQAERAALLNSAKDRAENTMIVDLLRNDLSRVCVPDSIEVAALCTLESFAAVHHLVSTVRGTLRGGVQAADVLRACFPGGSITGAPKIRAMEIIEELEQTRRGPYCGAMGYIGFDGAMDTNILIRTLVYNGNTVSLQAGGGITADSHPAQEVQETLDKAAAMFRSFELQVPSEKLQKTSF